MTTPNETLRTILPIAGWGDGQAADVVFTGGADPVLPTPFRIGAAGGATLPATRVAAVGVLEGPTRGGPRGAGVFFPGTASVGRQQLLSPPPAAAPSRR